MIAAWLALGSNDRLWLGLGILLCLGFEFVNGFHDSANAIAPLVYTRALRPVRAVLWCSLWNLVGAIAASGAVAFGLVALLDSAPDGLAIAVLLTVAIAWNLATWWRGIPLSSSQTLIGAIVGVQSGQLFSNHTLTWQQFNSAQLQATLEALFLSPLLGFGLAYLLLKGWRSRFIPLRQEVTSSAEESLSWKLRASLLLATAGMSFSHGTNDGQKGMGLLLLVCATLLPAQFAAAFNDHQLPLGIKLAVALSLAGGTLVGWRRISATLGEGLSDRSLTVSQALAATTVATATILGADRWGLPISTTQVLSAGIAGGALAEAATLKRRSLQRLLLAWGLTLPIAAGSAFLLYQLLQVWRP